MEWTRSIANRFGRSLQQFTHRQRRPSAFVERTISWLNSLWLYCRSQAVLSLTCLILFGSLVLMLLIYRNRRRSLIVERKASEQETTTTLRRQLKTTQSAQSGTQQSTKGRVVIDYYGSAERADQAKGLAYGQSNGDPHRPYGKQRYVDGLTKEEQLADGQSHVESYPPASRDQRQTNHQNHQNHQNRSKHQNDQIKQFENNESYLMNHAATTERRPDQPMNDGEPTGKLNYGNAFESERAKCQSDNKQQIEFNSRLKSLAKFDGHFCNKIFCCNHETNERRSKENAEQSADDGRPRSLNRQRTPDGIRQRTARRSGAKQTNQLDAIRRTGQLNDQSSTQTRPPFRGEAPVAQSECGCCCCPGFCLARSLRLRRELSRRQVENELCDCEFCTDRESENQPDEESTGSFDSCEQEHRCQKKRRIVNLIRESVSSRGSSLDGASEQAKRQLFDNEYRRLVRKGRKKQISRSNGDRTDGTNEDAIRRKYGSWSSHRHVSSPCR